MKHEEDIEDWYFNLQGQYTFTEYVCAKKALGGDGSCLSEKVKKKKKRTLYRIRNPLAAVSVAPSYWIN